MTTIYLNPHRVHHLWNFTIRHNKIINLLSFDSDPLHHGRGSQHSLVQPWVRRIIHVGAWAAGIVVRWGCTQVLASRSGNSPWSVASFLSLVRAHRAGSKRRLLTSTPPKVLSELGRKWAFSLPFIGPAMGFLSHTEEPVVPIIFTAVNLPSGGLTLGAGVGCPRRYDVKWWHCIWCRPDLYGMTLYLVGVALILAGWCCTWLAQSRYLRFDTVLCRRRLDFCRTTLYSVGAVPTLAEWRCTWSALSCLLWNGVDRGVWSDTLTLTLMWLWIVIRGQVIKMCHIILFPPLESDLCQVTPRGA